LGSSDERPGEELIGTEACGSSAGRRDDEEAAVASLGRSAAPLVEGSDEEADEPSFVASSSCSRKISLCFDLFVSMYLWQA
jgi:hypothetical protein